MENKSLATLAVILLTALFSQLALSSDNGQINDSWEVIESEGQSQMISAADLKSGKQWQNITSGENITAPAYLRTGSESRLVLRHRNDMITISADALIQLEAEKYSSEGLFTKIIQTLGYALFEIEHNTGRTSIVETPYLISVVKGTTFTVQVDPARTIVDLIEGQLQIKATRFDASTIIHTGQSARLGKSEKAISVQDTSARQDPATLLQQKKNIALQKRSDRTLSTPAADATMKARNKNNSGVASTTGNAASSGIAGAAEAIGPLLPASTSDTSLAPLLPLVPAANNTGAAPPISLPTLPPAAQP